MMKVEFAKTRFVGCRFPMYNKCVRPESFEVREISKEYIYKLPENLEVSVGDVVVVSSTVGFGVAVVTSIDVQVSKDFTQFSYVVGPVYVDAFNQEMQKKARLAELEEQMDKMSESLSKIAMFEAYAQSNESFKEILDEYKELKGLKI